MRPSVIHEILRNHKEVSADGDRFSVSEVLHLDVLATSGNEVLTLPKVKQIIVRELYLEVVTEKDESYFLEYDHVLGVRVKAVADARTGGRAGFAPL